MEKTFKDTPKQQRLRTIKFAKSLHKKSKRNNKEFSARRYELAEQLVTSSAPKWGGMKVSLIS